jgi:proteasome beta subunit
MKLPYLPDHDGSSFFDFVSTHHPELAFRSHGMAAGPDQIRTIGPVTVPSATTVLALKGS